MISVECIILVVLAFNFKVYNCFNIKMSSTTSRNSDNFRTKTIIPSKTQKVFERLDKEIQVGGAGGSSSLQGLVSLNSVWMKLKGGSWKNKPLQIVSDRFRKTLFLLKNSTSLPTKI